MAVHLADVADDDRFAGGVGPVHAQLGLDDSGKTVGRALGIDWLHGGRLDADHMLRLLIELRDARADPGHQLVDVPRVAEEGRVMTRWHGQGS